MTTYIKTKLISLTIVVWAIFPLMVVIVYSLFGEDKLDIALMNNVMKTAIILFAVLSGITIYLSIKSLFKKNKKNTDLAVSLVCVLAALAAVILFTPAMLNYFSS